MDKLLNNPQLTGTKVDMLMWEGLQNIMY